MPAVNSVTDLVLEQGIAVITLNSPPVNALSVLVREGLCEAFRIAGADTRAEAIVLICAGRTFIAGADIAEFRASMVEPSLTAFQDEMEGVEKPVVVAIHGTALGGGLELALCAHYRVAVSSARLGLPEVHLGLVPGAGGTQRLPRVVGPEKALEMISFGQHVPAKVAAEIGLIDEIVPEDRLRESAIALARKAVDQARPLKKVREMHGKVEAAQGHPEIFENFRKANIRKFRGFKAPEYAIRCIEAAVDLSFEEGLAFERNLFLELISSPQSAAQRHLFFAERRAGNIPDMSPDEPIVPVNNVGIVGAGTMGGGIAMNFLNAGIPVTIVEAKQEALERGLKIIRKNYEASARRGRFSLEEVEKRMSLLTPSLDIGELADRDLVIEAVFEDMDTKKVLFRKLDGICKSDAILATNTSGLDINEIASVTTRPKSVVGLHFFSPANVMTLLEVVRADHTSRSVIATSMKLAKRISKIAVLVGVCPGFVGNRMLAQRQREAEALVMEGVMPWDIDRVLYDFGFPMGPFAMSDLAGLDIGWAEETSRSESVRDVLCEMGRRGQKTKAGYYEYDENRTPNPSQVTENIIKDFLMKSKRSPRPVSDDEILCRCIYPMINEGVKILEEGKAIRASDIDIVWQKGYGWPAYQGGPMWYADQIGPDIVLSKMRYFQRRIGDQFKPAAGLERAVEEGKKISDIWN